MSMKSWTEEGFGFPLFVNNNFDKVKAFVAERLSPSERTDVMACEDDFELSEYIADNTGSTCTAEFIAECFRETLKVNSLYGFTFDGDTDQDEMIGFRPTYSWSDDADKLSYEEALKILKDLADKLGINATPDYFTAEYWG